MSAAPQFLAPTVRPDEDELERMAAHLACPRSEVRAFAANDSAVADGFGRRAAYERTRDGRSFSA